jgi:ATP-binding cassette, subfamily B (MDR/TAP), member 1
MKALLAQPISKLDNVSTGSVSNTITSSSNTIQLSISDNLSRMFEGFALLIAAYCIAFSYSWALTLVTSSALLFILVALSGITPSVIKHYKAVEDADAEHASIAGEIFASMRTVFSLGAEPTLSQRYYDCVDKSKQRMLKLAPFIGMQLGIVFFSMFASFSLAFWFGLKLFREGHIGSKFRNLCVSMSTTNSRHQRHHFSDCRHFQYTHRRQHSWKHHGTDHGYCQSHQCIT